MVLERFTARARSARCVGICGVACLIGVTGGCNILPRDDLRVFAQELRPAPAPEIDEAAVTASIREQTGVEDFKPADEFLADSPPVPKWAIGFMRILVDDD